MINRVENCLSEKPRTAFTEIANIAADNLYEDENNEESDSQLLYYLGQN